MRKVSVIIPNYNNARYIEACLGSVISQDYPDKEIIIVDDGSTDDSVSVIEKIIAENKSVKMRLICQDNQNAAIARNRGLQVVTGDYVLFLDSDDMLVDGALSYLVGIYSENADLVIGGYETMDTKGKKLADKKVTETTLVIDAKKDFGKVFCLEPVPSNKLYSMKIIRENGLVWGNVRIGQDLNFFLKYLALCEKIVLVDGNVYKYRTGNQSMTRAYDFRIFDIVNAFLDAERFYAKNGAGLLYKKYIPFLQLKHYGFQMSKQIYYKNRRARLAIVDYFDVNERNIDYSLCKYRNDDFRKMHKKYRLKCCLKTLMTSGLYACYKMSRNNKK